MCIEDDSFRRFRRLRSSNESNLVPGTSLAGVIAVFTDDSSALVNCTTEQQVTELALDWYFEENNSQKSSRVIWQRGRAKIDRYKAFSSDQFHHYLKIKPVYLNDSGTYTCLDQATGAQKRVELVVRKFNQDSYCFGMKFTLERKFSLLHD